MWFWLRLYLRARDVRGVRAFRTTTRLVVLGPPKHQSRGFGFGLYIKFITLISLLFSFK